MALNNVSTLRSACAMIFAALVFVLLSACGMPSEPPADENPSTNPPAQPGNNDDNNVPSNNNNGNNSPGNNQTPQNNDAGGNNESPNNDTPNNDTPGDDDTIVVDPDEPVPDNNYTPPNNDDPPLSVDELRQTPLKDLSDMQFGEACNVLGATLINLYEDKSENIAGWCTMLGLDKGYSTTDALDEQIEQCNERVQSCGDDNYFQRVSLHGWETCLPELDRENCSLNMDNFITCYQLRINEAAAFGSSYVAHTCEDLDDDQVGYGARDDVDVFMMSTYDACDLLWDECKFNHSFIPNP